jgi:hypothetical protein
MTFFCALLVLFLHAILADAFLLPPTISTRLSGRMHIQAARKHAPPPRLPLSLHMSTNNPNNFNLGENSDDDGSNYENADGIGSLNATALPANRIQLRGMRPKGVPDSVEGISQGPASEEYNDDNQVGRACARLLHSSSMRVAFEFSH